MQNPNLVNKEYTIDGKTFTYVDLDNTFTFKQLAYAQRLVKPLVTSMMTATKGNSSDLIDSVVQFDKELELLALCVTDKPDEKWNQVAHNERIKTFENANAKEMKQLKEEVLPDFLGFTMRSIMNDFQGYSDGMIKVV